MSQKKICRVEFYFSVYSIGVKFTTVTAKFTAPAPPAP